MKISKKSALFSALYFLFVIKSFGTPFTLDTTVVNVSCNGGSDGSITVYVDGGVPDYIYIWYKSGIPIFSEVSSDTTSTLSNISAGSTYFIVVEDGDGHQNAILNISVTEPNPLVFSSIVITDIDCFGDSDGAIDITVTGGTLPYSYNWSDGTGSGSVPTAQNQSDLTAGTYNLAVTDANKCTMDTVLTVSGPAAALSGSITSQTNIACFGESTGSVTIAGSGGTPAYEYSLDGGAYQGSGTFGSLSANSYTVTVRDANLCTHDVPVTITQPASALSGSIVSQTNVDCYGASTGSVTGSILTEPVC